MPQNLATATSNYPDAIARLFGAKAAFPSFEELYLASEDSANFDDLVGFWNFKELIGRAFASLEMYPTFQHDKMFHFVAAHSLMPVDHASEE